MAFRPKPQRPKSGPSLGYRISSDRQPGIEQANNRMPSRPMPSFPRPGQGRPMPAPMPMPFPRPGQVRPAPMPTPGPMEPMPMPFPRFPGTIGRPPMPGETGRSLGPAGGPVPPTGRSLRDLFEGMPGPDKFQDYLDRGLGSLREQAAVDPSDWRTLETILGAGGNPDDYVQTAMGPDDDYPMFPSGPGIRGPRLKYEPEVRELDLFDMMDEDTFLPDFDQDEYYSSGIMGALPEERQVAELGLPQPMDWQNERLSLDELINLGASEDQIAQYLGVA